MRSPSRLALPTVTPLDSIQAATGTGKECPMPSTKMDKAFSFGLGAKRTLHQVRGAPELACLHAKQVVLARQLLMWLVLRMCPLSCADALVGLLKLQHQHHQ